MKKLLLAGLTAASLVLAGTAAPAEDPVVPASLKAAFRQSTPRQRQQTRALWQSKYAGLPEELRGHLQGRYPELDRKLVRALGRVSAAHPGLVPGAARHLLEDLGEEPALAALDVAQAVVARYPDITRRGPEPESVLPEGFYVHLLDRLPKGTTVRLRKTVVDAVQARHASLPEEVLHTLLTGMPRAERRELWMRLRRGERPALSLWRENPARVLELARLVQEKHGPELRATLIDVLAALERDPALARAGQALLGLVESDYPELPSSLAAARRRRNRELLSLYPELPGVVAETMQSRHPQLLPLALESLRSHYPGLEAELWQAMETELPGIRAETRAFLAQRYPELWTDLESSLRGLGPGQTNPSR